jgi:hypothetical protein
MQPTAAQEQIRDLWRKGPNVVGSESKEPRNKINKKIVLCQNFQKIVIQRKQEARSQASLMHDGSMIIERSSTTSLQQRGHGVACMHVLVWVVLIAPDTKALNALRLTMKQSVDNVQK